MRQIARIFRSSRLLTAKHENKRGGIMPYKVVKRGGKRPYKIVEKLRGGHTKIVGSSTTKKDAQKSIVARKIHEKR